jgi:hypothetical protein
VGTEARPVGIRNDLEATLSQEAGAIVLTYKLARGNRSSEYRQRHRSTHDSESCRRRQRRSHQDASPVAAGVVRIKMPPPLPSLPKPPRRSGKIRPPPSPPCRGSGHHSLGVRLGAHLLPSLHHLSGFLAGSRQI